MLWGLLWCFCETISGMPENRSHYQFEYVHKWYAAQQGLRLHFRQDGVTLVSRELELGLRQQGQLLLGKYLGALAPIALLSQLPPPVSCRIPLPLPHVFPCVLHNPCNLLELHYRLFLYPNKSDTKRYHQRLSCDAKLAL